MLPSFPVLVSFALVVGLLTITPGIDTALVLRAAATSSRGRAWGTVLGIQAGVLVWGAAAAIGVSALLAASQLAFDLVRIAGAIYLVFLGVRLLWSAIRGTAHTAASTSAGSAAGAARGDTFFTGFRQGAVTNLLNPKVGAFYVALLPQFIPTGAPPLPWGLALAGVHVLLGVVWLGTLLLVARTMRRWLQRPAVARWIDGIAGTVITGFGVKLALDH